ncbi:MAG TPA: DUF1573 domain-containing protein [Verrucomicrobiae bacterium]|nr:DUF1573 domain-containing protein [Verrucomicrobiae bacterium]
MRSKFIRFGGRFLYGTLLMAGAQWVGVGALSAQPVQPATPVPAFAPPHPPQQQPSPLELLQWDSVLKEMSPKPGELTANFDFKVSNPTEQNILIERVQTSCGCTVAKLPAQPWVLVPHTNGEIKVTVNLMGKSGTVWKTITVYSTNNIQKILTVKVNLPENPQVTRMRNQAMAAADPQAIFRGDCAKCHVDKGRGLMGKKLYVASCGICHEANPRATMVPDLHALPHPTDYAYWKQIISEGKPHTMMPGFSNKHGGPLTDEQVDSLAKVLNEAFSSSGRMQPRPNPTPTKTSAATTPRQPIRQFPPAPPVTQN